LMRKLLKFFSGNDEPAPNIKDNNWNRREEC
jgi:hypothetical protein